jgi:hypothetical protein
MPDQEDDFPLDDGPKVIEDDDYLDWTVTPQTVMQSEGNVRCIISQRAPSKQTRHALHLVREFALHPSISPEKGVHRILSPSARCRLNKKPMEIRVREEDFRKYGGNIDVLTQCAVQDKLTPDRQSHHMKLPVLNGAFRWNKHKPWYSSGPAPPQDTSPYKAPRTLSSNKLCSSLPSFPPVRSSSKNVDPDNWRAVRMTKASGASKHRSKAKTLS